MHEIGHFVEMRAWERESALSHLLRECDARTATVVLNDSRVRFTSESEQLPMHKLDIDEPSLTAALAEAIVSWRQIVQHVCAFVDRDVTLRIFGLVGRPSDVCEVPGYAIATVDDTLRLEPMVL